MGGSSLLSISIPRGGGTPGAAAKMPAAGEQKDYSHFQSVWAVQRKPGLPKTIREEVLRSPLPCTSGCAEGGPSRGAGGELPPVPPPAAGPHAPLGCKGKADRTVRNTI